MNAWIDEYKQKKAPRAISYSGTKELNKSAAHLWAYWTEPRKPPTKAMRIGKLWHSLALNQTYRIEDYKKDELDIAKTMLKVLKQHELAQALLFNTKQKQIIERFGIFDYPDFGFETIIRPDCCLPESNVILELKSATDASHRAFKKAVRWFQYDWQALIYKTGANLIDNNVYRDYLILAQETKAPFGIVVYKLSDYWFEKAQGELYPLWQLYSDCLAKNEWPSYPATIMEI
jgi:hypothetical protein